MVRIDFYNINTYWWWNCFKIFRVVNEFQIGVGAKSVVNVTVFSTSLLIWFFSLLCILLEECSKVQRINHPLFVTLWSNKLGVTWPYTLIAFNNIRRCGAFLTDSCGSIIVQIWFIIKHFVHVSWDLILFEFIGNHLDQILFGNRSTSLQGGHRWLGSG